MSNFEKFRHKKIEVSGLQDIEGGQTWCWPTNEYKCCSSWQCCPASWNCKKEVKNKRCCYRGGASVGCYWTGTGICNCTGSC